MLTDWQKHRVGFHLGYTDTFPVEWETAGIGDYAYRTITGDPAGALMLVQGLPIGTAAGLLGRIEAAYAKLDSETIEDSLFVSSAGAVNLRGDELTKRRKLYNSLVKDLSNVTGIPMKSCNHGPSHAY